ncbi:MAG TPA: 3D domain-containing protein [Syntrophales bacterium]|nr:3D domain-containing protein [Syntrophales bacterium]
MAVTPSRRRGLQAAVMLIGITLLISGCATLSSGEKADRETRRMLVTAYDPGPKSTGWEYRFLDFFFTPVYAYGPHKGKVKEVGMTSSGKKAKKGTIAADIRRYPYGTQMHVPGYGWGEVQDTGSAIKGDHIDVFFPKEKDAIAWGRKYLDVTIIRRME